MRNMNTLLSRRNCSMARKRWNLERKHPLLATLRLLSEDFKLSLLAGDLILLQNNWYVTHTGLLRIAKRSRCSGMRVQFIGELSDVAAHRFAFEATVFKSRSCQGFVGYGDADPSNVAPLVRGAELRMAETRAINRALRKAYGIGICSVEEIGSLSESTPPSRESKKLPPQPVNGNNGHGGPKVRDRLCQIIRQHQLDPNLVKAYAVDFCSVKILREATREQVENFVSHLSDWAEKDRNALGVPAQQLSRWEGRCSVRRHFESLRPADVSALYSVPDRLFLVRVDRAQYRWHKQKPYYEIRFVVLKPKHLTGCLMTGRLYCTPRAMWRVSWFLRDFGYDPELLQKNEIDDKDLVDLWGVVKVSEVTVHGISVLNFDSFAPAARWEQLSIFNSNDHQGSGVSS